MHRMLSLGIAVTVAATLWAQSKPAEPAGMAAAAAQGRLSPMIIKNVRPVKATLQATTQTTLRQVAPVIGKMMTELDEAARDAFIIESGRPMAIYRGMIGGADAPFEMTVAYPVPEGAGGNVRHLYKVKPLDGGKAATFYYTGPMSGFGMAYGKAFAQVGMAALRPTGEIREVYLFWEDPTSPNNVVELHIFVTVPPVQPISAPVE